MYFWKCKWTVYGGMRTWYELQIDNEIHGYPFRIIYPIGIEFNIAGFFLKLEHFCNHAVKSNALHSNKYVINGGEYYTVQNRWWSNYWGENMTTIQIGFKEEFTIWTN